MIEFFEQTWFLWWILAIAVILRWFHVLSSQPACDETEESGEAGSRDSQHLGTHLPMSA